MYIQPHFQHPRHAHLHVQVPFCFMRPHQLMMAFNGDNVLYGILFTFTAVEGKKKITDSDSPLFFVFFSHSDAKERTTRSFSAGGVFNFTTLHLSKEDNALYIGAREILFALNLSDISQAKLQRNVRAQPVGSNINEVIIGSPRRSMNMVVNMTQPQESSVNITPSVTVLWFQHQARPSLCLSPAAHVDDPAAEKGRVQFQRQRPSGKWADAVMELGCDGFELRVGAAQLDHRCRAADKLANVPSSCSFPFSTCLFFSFLALRKFPRSQLCWMHTPTTLSLFYLFI